MAFVTPVVEHWLERQIYIFMRLLSTSAAASSVAAAAKKQQQKTTITQSQ